MKQLTLSKIFILSVTINALALIISIYFYINDVIGVSFLVMMANSFLNYKLISYWEGRVNSKAVAYMGFFNLILTSAFYVILIYKIFIMKYQ